MINTIPILALNLLVPYAYSKLQKSYVDNLHYSKIFPERGCVVYCNLGLPGMLSTEHTGIYVGDNRIVHLNGKGEVESVNSAEFLSRLGGLNPAISIYVSTKAVSYINVPLIKEISAGSDIVADRALAQVKNKVKYDLLKNNCNNFTVGCLTGYFNNNSFISKHVKNCAEEILGVTGWRVGIFDDD